jgi:HlyD family secretion protein
MTPRNRIALGLAIAAAAALSVWALRPAPVAVELAEVERGPFERSVRDDGKTRVRERYTVSAPLAGHLERIPLRAGDAVNAGDRVAVIAPVAPALLDARSARELEARVGAAAAQVARAKAEHARLLAQRDQARADEARQEKLFREGFISAAAREQSQLALRTAERAAEAARFAEQAAAHDLAQARAAVARYRGDGGTGATVDVTSPVRGSVLRVIQESEGPVGIGAPLIELADARSLEAIVDVLSQESVEIRPGMPARLDIGRGAPPLAARVRRVEPAAFTKISALGVEEQRVNVVLDFAEPLDRIQTIGDGFRVDAVIVVDRVEDAVKVPVGALFRDGDGWAVFVAQGAKAAKRRVSAPQRNGVEARVEDGLRVREKVIVYPPDTLREGARIEPVGNTR